MNQHAELRARLFVCRRAPQLACWMARKSEKELTRTKLQPQKTRRWRVGPRPRSGCPGPSDSKVQTRPTKRVSVLPSYKLSCIYRYSRIPAKKLCRSTQTQGMGWHTAASPNVSDILVPREIQQRGVRELLRHSWQFPTVWFSGPISFSLTRLVRALQHLVRSAEALQTLVHLARVRAWAFFSQMDGRINSETVFGRGSSVLWVISENGRRNLDE